MPSPKTNAIIDILIAILFIVSAVSGFALKTKLHYRSSVILVILVIIHLFLHWKWILNIPKYFNK